MMHPQILTLFTMPHIFEKCEHTYHILKQDFQFFVEFVIAHIPTRSNCFTNRFLDHWTLSSQPLVNQLLQVRTTKPREVEPGAPNRTHSHRTRPQNPAWNAILVKKNYSNGPRVKRTLESYRLPWQKDPKNHNSIPTTEQQGTFPRPDQQRCGPFDSPLRYD